MSFSIDPIVIYAAAAILFIAAVVREWRDPS